MASTLLADLVRRQTATSVIGVFSRTVDKVAEDLALELLRDPATRDELRAIVKVAFESALKELHGEPPPPEHDTSRARLTRLETLVDELRRGQDRS
jgi:hypothetical protein